MRLTTSVTLLAVAVAALAFMGCTDDATGDGGTGGTAGGGGTGGSVAGICPDSAYCIDGAVEAPTIGIRSASVITVDGLDFKDANGNGELDLYEDWRLSVTARAEDLVSKMSVDQQIGLLSLSDTAETTDEEGALNDRQIEAITNGHVRHALLRWSPIFGGAGQSATVIAKNHNNMQELAESLPLGIPMVITTDPAMGAISDTTSSMLVGVLALATQLTSWPAPLGFGAIDDEDYIKQVGAAHAAQLRATGVRWMLAPQLDVLTEPMWSRIADTYGADPDRVGALGTAYTQGLQGKDDGVNPFTGVAATVKHFPGQGAQENGMASHSEWGKYNVFPGDNFEAHIEAMRDAIEGANPAAIMPCFSIFEDQEWNGMPVEQLSSHYSKVLLQDLLRGDMGWDGFVTSDWGAVGACFAGPESCTSGQAWGTETWTSPERVAGYAEAGGHQIGNAFAEVGFLWQEALAAETITEDQIAAAAQKALELTFKVGAFEDPYVDESQAVPVQESFEDDAHEAMMKAFTLLRNDDAILPLDENSADQNETAGIQVFFDGFDDTKILDYTSKVTGFVAVDDIALADYAVIRMSARHGSYFGFDGGVPLGLRDPIKVYDQDTGMPSDEDSTALPLFGPGAEANNADGNAIADSIDAHIAAKGTETKLIFAVSTFRPFIWDPYLADTSVLAAEFGMTDEALLDMVFQMSDFTQDPSIQPSGKLPVELPSTQDAVYAAFEDMPHDSENPSFSVGDGITSY